MDRRKRDRSRSPVQNKDRTREKDHRKPDRARNEKGDSQRHSEDKTSSHRREGHKPKHDTRDTVRKHEDEDRVFHPRQRHNERRSPERERNDSHPGRNDRRTREEGDERLTRPNDRETRGRRERQDQGNDERRRPAVQRQRDRRREKDDETDDTSRYGVPAGEENNEEAAVEAEQPNFGLSGKLTEYTNTYKGVVIKYNEPPEGRKPKTRWRLYPFKGEEGLPVLYIHRQSAYLMGRQRHIADIPIDHPSCSKQHAVLQYRLANFERADGTAGRKVKPYILDLESANGTFLNNEKIDPRRYYELKERDVLKFGFSSREYVILHEKSMNTEAQEGAVSGSDESPESVTQ